MAYIGKILGNVYVASVLGILATTSFLGDLQFIFDGAPPVLLFLVVIAFSAWHGGFKAGVLSTVLSVFSSDYFLIEPYQSLYIAKSSEILRVTTLFVVGVICSRSIARIHEREKQALKTVLERESQLRQEIVARNQSLSDKHIYALLAKSSTEFIGMCDTNGVPFFINQAGLNLVGLDCLEQGLKTSVEAFFFSGRQGIRDDSVLPLGIASRPR